MKCIRRSEEKPLHVHKYDLTHDLGNSPRSNPPLLHIMSPDKQRRDPSDGNSSDDRNKGFSDSGYISVNDRLLLFFR
jgi:hypothetical protein